MQNYEQNTFHEAVRGMYAYLQQFKKQSGSF